MRRILGSVGAALALITGSLLIAAPAQADTATITYTITADPADPLIDRWVTLPVPTCSTTSNWGNLGRTFRVATATVDVTGPYSFTDMLAPNDGRMVILDGAFDPADLTNCIAAIEDANSVTLQAGSTYTVLLSSLDGFAGEVSYLVNGPGLFEYEFSTLPTGTTAASSAASVTIGDTVDLSATVAAPWFLRFNGTVEFFAGTTSLGSATMNPTTNTAVLPGILLPVGSHSITAAYGGYAPMAGSTSDPITVQVNRSVTSTTLNGTPNPVTVGEEVQLTATVTGVSPTGTVAFFVGTDSLGTATLSAGTATLPISTLPVGTQTITAAYSGDASHEPSSSPAFSLAVQAVPEARPSVKQLASTGGLPTGTLLGAAFSAGALGLLLMRRARASA